MTKKFKQGMEALMSGGSIAILGNGKYRIRDANNNPIMSIRYSTYVGYIRHCKKKGNIWILNKKKILTYHGKSWVKKRYKEVRGNQAAPSTRCPKCKRLLCNCDWNDLLNTCRPCPPIENMNPSPYKLSL